MAEHLTVKNTDCLNCGTTLKGNFCKQCGQATNIHRINFKETLSQFLSSTFTLEGPLMITLKQLIINPGLLYREYIGGRRKTYYKPIALFVLATALYLILRNIINYDPLAGEFAQSSQQDGDLISANAEEALKLMADNINKIMFLLVFSIAIMLKLFFRKKYNFAEYTSVGFFIAGFYTLLKILTMFISKFTLVDLNDTELVIAMILIFYSVASLFQGKDFISLLKYSLVSLFSLLLYVLFSLGFFFLIILLN